MDAYINSSCILCDLREGDGEGKQLEYDICAYRQTLLVADQLKALVLAVGAVIERQLVRELERVHEGVLPDQLDLHVRIVEVARHLRVTQTHELAIVSDVRRQGRVLTFSVEMTLRLTIVPGGP